MRAAATLSDSMTLAVLMALWFGYVAARAGSRAWAWAGVGFVGTLLINALAGPFGSTFYGRVGFEDGNNWYERHLLPALFRTVACAAAAVLFPLRLRATSASPRGFETCRNYADLFHKKGEGPNVAIIFALLLSAYLQPAAWQIYDEAATTYLAVSVLAALSFFLLHTWCKHNWAIVGAWVILVTGIDAIAIWAYQTAFAFDISSPSWSVLLRVLTEGLLLAGFVLGTRWFGARWWSFVGAATVPNTLWILYEGDLSFASVAWIVIDAAARGGSVYLAILVYHRFTPPTPTDNTMRAPA